MQRPEPQNNQADAAALNQALVDDLKKKGLIQTRSVEAAFRAVRRHLFLPETPLEEVYSDRAISAKQDPKGQWLSSSSQPAIMAIMLEQLGLQPGHKVLEIGTGPGYNAALMAHIVGETGQVVSIEIEEDLAQAAREHLAAAGYPQVQVVGADGGYGFPEAAPFDRIILTVGAPDITPAWWNQMKPAGRMVLPLMLRGSMKSIAFEQVNDHLSSISVSDCGFISLRGDFAVGFPTRIQLGPEPGVYLEPMGNDPIEGETIYGLLSDIRNDSAANVEVTVWDVLSGSLWTWLALHEPRMCKLVAEGDRVEQTTVPALIKIEGRQRSFGTVMLVGEKGVAVLSRPPDQPAPSVPFDKLFVPDSPAAQPFTLFVRQCGPDDSIVQRMLQQIEAWKAAGQPPTEKMHIRAYAKDSAYKPLENEIVVEKQWTKLIIEWPAAM